MSSLNFKEEQKRYAAQTSYENLLRRALDYSGDVYDEAKYIKVAAYLNVTAIMAGISFKNASPEKAFIEMKAYLTIALERLLKEKISIQAKNRIKDLIPIIKSFLNLSQVDEVVSEILELISPMVDHY